MSEELPWQGPSGPAVLDIGGDVGALVVYTAVAWCGTELEIYPEGKPQALVHTGVRERSAGPPRVVAAVFPALTAGRYDILGPRVGAASAVEVVGGAVTEVDLR